MSSTTKIEFPTQAEVDAIIAQARRMRTETIANFFRGVFRRPAKTAVIDGQIA